MSLILKLTLINGPDSTNTSILDKVYIDLYTCEVLWRGEVRPHLSGSQRIELLNPKLDMWIGGLESSVSLFIFLKCHPRTCEESHTGPSMITLCLLAASRAMGHVPNALHIKVI